jgi:hypothetical protein
VVAGGAVEHLGLGAVREASRRRHELFVRVPMRIVRREHQDVVGAELIDDAEQLARVARSVDGLKRDANVLPNVLGRRAPRPRHLTAQAAPALVEPPQERRQPREPRFDQRHAEPGEPIERPLGDEARQL